MCIYSGVLDRFPDTLNVYTERNAALSMIFVCLNLSEDVYRGSDPIRSSVQLNTNYVLARLLQVLRCIMGMHSYPCVAYIITFVSCITLCTMVEWVDQSNNAWSIIICSVNHSCD